MKLDHTVSYFTKSARQVHPSPESHTKPHKALLLSIGCVAGSRRTCQARSRMRTRQVWI